MKLTYDMIQNIVNDLIDNTLSSGMVFKKFNLDKDSILNLIIDFLNESIQKKDADMLDCIVYIIFYFDLSSEPLLDIYDHLLLEKWHYKHEDLVTLIDPYRSEKSLAYLYKAATMRFEYLMYDDDITFALASKCIWTIGNIGTHNAQKYLMKLAQCDNIVIADKARRQLTVMNKKNDDVAGGDGHNINYNNF